MLGFFFLLLSVGVGYFCFVSLENRRWPTGVRVAIACLPVALTFFFGWVGLFFSALAVGATCTKD
jgi:hypothetical protein